MDAKVLITECTFFERDHRRRAQVGQHMHVADLIDALPQLANELVLLSHVSRRTHLKIAKNVFKDVLLELERSGHTPPRVEFLMDYAQRLQVKPGRAAPFAVTEREIADSAE